MKPPPPDPRITTLPRRRTLVALGSVLALAACGFRLRGAPSFAFDTIWLSFGPDSAFGNEVRRTLSGGGTVRVVDERVQAEVWLQVLDDARERVVVATSAAGQVREVQLRRRVRFNLLTPDGRVLLDGQEIVQTRDLAYDESTALARQAEESLIFRSMQTDMVTQLIRRLAAVQGV